MTNAEIQVGEYVRTIYGMIGKIENINDYRPPESRYAVDIQLGDLIFLGEKNILKHSFDIIDLIEVGDYVNGELVVEKDKDGIYTGIETDYEWLDRTDIKTIVTKEQFKNMEIRLVEIMTNAKYYLKDGVNARKFSEKLADYILKDITSYEGTEKDIDELIEEFLNINESPTLTEDERVILRNIDKKFKSIKRANDSYLYLVMEDNSFRDIRYEFEVFPNLFQFIKERRRI